MKTVKPFMLAAALAAASTLASPLMAGQLYNVNYVMNPGTYYEFSVVGSITTDGTMGTITKNNLAVVDLAVTTSNGTFAATNASDVLSLQATATSNDLWLAGNDTQDFTLQTDGTTGVMFQLYYDPMAVPAAQDSIFVQTTPTYAYYYYSATSLAPISLSMADGSLAPAPKTLDISAAPEPSSVGLTGMASLLMGFGWFVKNRRKKQA